MQKLVNPTFKLVKGNELTPYQLYRAKWFLFPEYRIVDKMPLAVDIELNTTCNRACSYCEQSLDKPEPQLMDIRQAKAIIDQLDGVYAIKLNWRGESLIYPGIEQIIKYAKLKGILDVRINTNGDMLGPRMNKALLEAGLDMMSISIHEGTDSLKLRKKLEAFQNEKWFSKTGNTIVRVQTLDTLIDDKFEEFWSYVADEIGSEICLDRMDDTEDHRWLPEFSCHQLWNRIFVACDGSIVPCCRALKGGNELLEVLGNIKTMTIREAWHSNRMKVLREWHTIGMSAGARMCRLCGVRKIF